MLWICTIMGFIGGVILGIILATIATCIFFKTKDVENYYDTENINDV